MTNLENLTSKIIKEAENKKNSILEEAHKIEQDTIIRKEEEANIKKLEILQKAQEESKTRAERVISNGALKVRNKKLEAKQNMIDEVFNESLEKLKNLPKNDYVSFIEKSIAQYAVYGDEEVIISSRDVNIITQELINKINMNLISMGRNGNLKLSTQKRNIIGGYILAKNGVEVNNSFEALVSIKRDELEEEVINLLFG
ncbi:V-type ATP synthase subunit E [Clostridium peptidivorans]|uniref:V-type ATP synthase subunit E n=1 Tax=Clostridium peptidivorans TaxID=100174 RepID=UPI000BE24A9D|nr:V-type ATP synthase subunit E family protein [Clostridium peptidivorans]